MRRRKRSRLFSLSGSRYRWRGMPVKQHVQEIGGQEGGWEGSAPVTLAVSCRSEGSRDTIGKREVCLVTPGSGHGRPFCSRSRWGPGMSTHPVCHMTWGKESPERRKQKRQHGNTFMGWRMFQEYADGERTGPRRETFLFHLMLLFSCVCVWYDDNSMDTCMPWPSLSASLPDVPKTHTCTGALARLPLLVVYTHQTFSNIKQICEDGRLVFIRLSCKR